MRIILAGGGTGGHVFPSLEIAKEIKRVRPDCEIIIAGNADSLEEKVARNNNLTFFNSNSAQIASKRFFEKILALKQLAISTIKCVIFLLRYRPTAIIGVGGNVSVPAMIAGFLLGIRTYICEQNVKPGLANNVLKFIAHRIFISFKESAPFFPKSKILFTGNPIRQEFFESKRVASDKFRILITGGSLGSRALNEEVPKALKMCGHLDDLEVTHQTGLMMVDQVKSTYKDLGINAEVLTFIDNMPALFAKNDLLISRAGATVSAEILAFGMPALLIPYPHANAHQVDNARALESIGVATMVLEGPNLAVNLSAHIRKLYENRALLREMGQKAAGKGHKDAAKLIVETVLNDT